jgi:hypothetical protein
MGLGNRVVVRLLQVGINAAGPSLPSVFGSSAQPIGTLIGLFVGIVFGVLSIKAPLRADDEVLAPLPLWRLGRQMRIIIRVPSIVLVTVRNL